MGERVKISDYIISFLSTQGVTHIFEVIGGMTTHLVDSAYRCGSVRLISTHHEQAAAFAAEAMARITGIPGVAMATSGPGATNLLTGIGSCYFDSLPAIFLTGQVNRLEQKGNRNVRQLGFQETDIVAMVKPVTKGAWCVKDPQNIPEVMNDAFKLALSGRPGPVLVDIPMDIQRTLINDSTISRISREHDKEIDKGLLEEIIRALCKAKRPLILAGNGVNLAGVRDLFRRFVRKIKVPVVYSLMAVDVLPYDSDYKVGMIGTYGNRWANLALGQSDFLLVLGSRLDIRQTGSDVHAFQADRNIYHVDCDIAEINNRAKGCHAVNTDLSTFLIAVLEVIEKDCFSKCNEWMSWITECKNKWPDTSELKEVEGINPNAFVHALSAKSGQSPCYVIDVGQHQMWAAQSTDLLTHQRFLTSGGMGAMGFALPAAIGSSFAFMKQPIVMVAGDGGFQINIQELETVAYHKLPIKMAVFNNQCYGMVRQFQQSYFNERYQSTYWGYSSPDFSRVARAYGIQSLTLKKPSDVDDALDQMWQDPKAPFLLQVMISPLANVYPKIAFGRAFTEMEPYVKPVSIEETQ